MRALKGTFLIPVLAAVVACSSEGPTAIELPIAELTITDFCSSLIEGNRCPTIVEAKTAGGQVVLDPILRWSTSDASVASVDEDGVVEGRGAGRVTVRVSNSTDTVSDQVTISVFGQNPK